MERTAEGEFGDLVETNERTPQYDSAAQFVDATSPSSAGELRVLPRRQGFVVVTSELGQLFDHDGAGRHVDTDRQRLGSKHDLGEAFDEARLDNFLERRNHAGMMRCYPSFQLGDELLIAEHVEIGLK